MASDSQSESQETTSTSLVEDALNISFEDISYTVRQGILGRGRKTVLDRMSGTFNAGELNVIMGQSGAGKSSLMDILAGYKDQSQGRILVNGRPRNYKMFRRRSCYILQDDMVQSFLTVQESLVIAAELKLGDHINVVQKHNRIEEIIKSLGLLSVRDTRAGLLSGGQRKRLAIGLELVSDPPVMFVDEPTSGLDSSMSKQILYLLHLLARQNRTVVVTMHQPSATLLSFVDRLYLIDKGQCAYTGSIDNLLPYLEHVPSIERCPAYHNPVDYLIEICSDGGGPSLVESSRNGKNDKWSIRSTDETDVKVETIKEKMEDIVYLTGLPAPCEDPTSKILLKLKSTYSTSFWKQFAILTRRSLLSMWRDPSNTYMITGIHCAMALFMGLLFYNIGIEGENVRNNYSFIQFSLMFLMFTAFSSVSIKFPEQFPVVRREHFNRWYMTGSYYAATLIASLPMQTVCTLSFTCITFWLTGQPPEFIRFISYCWILSLVAFAALCIGLLNGSLFTIKNGVIFGPLMIMPFTVFSGFFLLYNDAPFIFRWLFHISFLKHGLVGTVLSIYGMDRPKLSCSSMYCHYVYPRQLLIDLGMTEDTYYVAVLALMVITVVVVSATYVVLKFRLKSKY